MSQKIKHFLIGSSILSLIISVTFVCLLRFWGILEAYELNLLDRFFVRWQQKTASENIILVEIAEEDIARLDQYPLSDRQLTQILERIKQTRPRVIGLDLIRDLAVYDKNLSLEQNQLAFERLQKIFRETENLYGIAKISETTDFPSVSGSRVLKEVGRLTAADLVLDRDGVARRGNLYPDYEREIQGLGLAIALKYLEPEKIYLQYASEKESRVCPLPQDYTQEGWFQFNERVLCPLTPRFGGYATHSDSGYQILVDWRSCKSNLERISIHDILANNFNPSLLRDRLVLIGNTSISAKDRFLTPCSQNTGNTPDQTSGVEIIARLADRIIEIARGTTSPITAWGEVEEIAWIAIWASGLQLIFWGAFRLNNLQFWLFSLGSVICCALFVCYFSFYLFSVRGLWLPLLPVWLCFSTQSFLTIFIFFSFRLIRTNNTLEIQVRERTRTLQQAFDDLKNIQQKMIAQEKLNFLGKNTVYISHEIRNPLGCIELANLISLESLKQLTDRENPDPSERANWQKILDNSYLIDKQVERIDRIITLLNERIRANDVPPLDCNLQQIIEEALEITIYSFGIRHHWTESIGIETDYAPDLPPVKLYSTDFERALSNLIDNSLYSLKQKKSENPSFSPRLRLSTERLEEERIRLIIEDNGQGIAPEDKNRVFEEFYSTKGEEGTGLGLFIVKQIINKHNGDIDISTKMGEFTKITIVLQIDCFTKNVSSHGNN